MNCRLSSVDSALLAGGRKQTGESSQQRNIVRAKNYFASGNLVRSKDSEMSLTEIICSKTESVQLCFTERRVLWPSLTANEGSQCTHLGLGREICLLLSPLSPEDVRGRTDGWVRWRERRLRPRPRTHSTYSKLSQARTLPSYSAIRQSSVSAAYFFDRTMASHLIGDSG